MNIIKQMLTMLLMKIYFFITGEEFVTKNPGTTIRMNIEVDNVTYGCVCQEFIFKAKSDKLFSVPRVNRLYVVDMISKLDNIKTQGTYPTLCPDKFIYTSYPHMLAIKCHYKLFYKT